MTYWHSVFLQCGSNQGQGGAWYAVTSSGPNVGSIQMVRDLRIQFQTNELPQVSRLNGVEFMASTRAEGPVLFRWWSASDKAWRDWQVGEIGLGRNLIKKKGVWSEESGQDGYYRKALTSCSEVPPMDDKR
jgi:hypothetical protein